MTDVKRPTLHSQPYDNYSMHGPDGQWMCYCGKKRMQWYLKRGLAEMTSETSFQLKFQPKGTGHSESSDYYKEVRENRCVVCGVEERLTKHHIVPYCYRRHLPEVYVSNNCFDVVVICEDCHDAYERTADVFKKQLLDDAGVTHLHKHDPNVMKEMKKVGLVQAVQKHFEKMPTETLQQRLDAISELWGEEHSLVSVLAMEVEKVKPPAIQYPSQEVLTALISDGVTYEQFIVMWRQHFLDYANPQFLNDKWRADYQTYFGRDCE